jgi:isopenicillin-N epimerase
MASELASAWSLDPQVAFLNHGSFGATPRSVLSFQQELRTRLESDPVRFFQRELEGLLDAALVAIGSFVGADPADLAPVVNATTGVNAVLRSLRLAAGDELLVSDHAYNACRQTMDWVAARSGAKVVVVPIPFPPVDDESVVAAFVERAGPRTRLALVDHVTSPTALVLPVAAIVKALDAIGVDTLVDGAHAPGMVLVDLTDIGAAYYTANCHKWMCSPKGAGFLHARSDRQEGLVPVVVSHGLNSEREDRPRYRLLFDWVGTGDPTPILSVPTAIEAVAALLPAGWDGVRAVNHELALRGAGIIQEAVGGTVRADERWLGSMVALTIPAPPAGRFTSHPLHDRLFHEHAIEVPVYTWNDTAMLRISAHLYNDDRDFERLASALTTELAVV